MSQHPAFMSLVASCSLLAMKGIVPSLLALQQQLQQQVTNYAQHLSEQRYPSNEIEALQRLVCRVVDGLAHKNCTAQNIRWQGHELAPLFFGYQHSELFMAAHSEVLIHSPHAEIQQAAQFFSALALPPLPADPRRAVLPLSQPAALAPACAPSAEPAPIYAEDPGRPIRWRSLATQIFAANLLLAGVWCCCHTLLNGGW